MEGKLEMCVIRRKIPNSSSHSPVDASIVRSRHSTKVVPKKMLIFSINLDVLFLCVHFKGKTTMYVYIHIYIYTIYLWLKNDLIIQSIKK